jgi:diketogulonate reductase-like aldo/keto reductase
VFFSTAFPDHAKIARFQQNRLYAETGYDKELRAFCREWAIVYQSFWTLTANPHILGSRVVQELARIHRKTEAQIFFRYLMQIGIVPLTATTSDQHMQEDLAILILRLRRMPCPGSRLCWFEVHQPRGFT